MTLKFAGLASNQPLLRRSRQHRHQQQFDQPPVTVAQFAACKPIGADEKRGTKVDHRIISSKPAADAVEKDDSLLNTTTFSEPDFGGSGDVSNKEGNTFTMAAPSKPKTKSISRNTTNSTISDSKGNRATSKPKSKTKSILRDTTNKVRNLREKSGPAKGKQQKENKERKSDDENDKVKVQVVREKQVLEPQKAQNYGYGPIKAQVKQSKRETSNETPVTFSQPVMGKQEKDNKERNLEKKDKVEVQVGRNKKTKHCASIIINRVELSKREASNETPVTSSQPEMTLFQDTQDFDTRKFDGSFFNKGFNKQTDKEMKTRRRLWFTKNTETVTPVVSNKSEVIPITPTDEAVNTTNSSTEGERSFMTVSFSLDDSILTAEVMPSDEKRTDEPLFLCGIPQAVMFEIHCHSNVLDAVSYSFSEVKNFLKDSITHEPKHKSGRLKTGELRSSKSLLM